MNDHRDHIMGWMNELWNKWRGYLHEKYVKDNPIQQSLKNIPRVVDKKEWEWSVKEHFTSESFQGRSIRNATNRSKLRMLHHIGSKPIQEIIYQKVGKMAIHQIWRLFSLRLVGNITRLLNLKQLKNMLNLRK